MKKGGYTRFEIDGQIFYQQGRKCGKNNCQCANGQQHGPYWYRRNQESGKVRYIGKNLSSEVVAAIEAIMADGEKIIDKRLELEEQSKALARLLAGESLSDSDCEIIKDFGFGACLVSGP